jgi:RNA 2',3'-cyclic 3'-phosphodiesterase
MNAPAGTLRVFIALDIPPEAKQALTHTITQLQSAIPSGVRWVDPAGIHLTLKFLGNIEAALADHVLAAMGQAAASFGSNPFHLALSHLGVFPNARQPRVLWAGAQGDLESLERLQIVVDEAVSPLGFAREQRPFRPHLTLGRVRDGAPPPALRAIGEAVTDIRLPPVAGWKVDTMYLIRSTLTPNGAIYTSLGNVAL